MKNGFSLMKNSFSQFPIINIYQIQNISQAKILDEEAQNIDYYLKSRKEIESIFNTEDFVPKRWSNYRPLWYKYYNNEMLPDNSFGQLEQKILKKNKKV